MSDFLNIEVDYLVGAAYITIGTGPSVKTVTLDNAVNIDYGKDGRIIGIEIL